jgi:hypothetical protein
VQADCGALALRTARPGGAASRARSCGIRCQEEALSRKQGPAPKRSENLTASELELRRFTVWPAKNGAMNRSSRLNGMVVVPDSNRESSWPRRRLASVVVF